MRTAAASIDRGLALYRKGAITDAMREYRNALKLDPRSAIAFTNLAACYTAQGRHHEAAENMLRAAALSPRHFAIVKATGAALARAGRLKEAADQIGRALLLSPAESELRGRRAELLFLVGDRATAAEEARKAASSAAPPLISGIVLFECGFRDEARPILEAASGASDDAETARFLLASIGGVLPERASPAMIQQRYRAAGEKFDRMAERGTYRYQDLICALATKDRIAPCDIADLGCGTGLCGVKLRPIARTLHGVDLSREMLDRATAKKIYDELYQADLIDFLAQRQRRYDVIVASAVLMHFGPLDVLISSIAAALRDGGRLVFSLFPSKAADIEVVSGVGAFAHGESYIRDVCERSGFLIEHFSKETCIALDDEPEIAMIVAAQKVL